MKVVIFDDLLCQHQRQYHMQGLELAFYEDGDRALEMLDRERPDVVLLDFSMDAVLCGAEVVAWVRMAEDLALRRLRIVAISSDRESNERMLEAGADDAVPKTHVRGYLHRLLDRQTLAHNLR